MEAGTDSRNKFVLREVKEPKSKTGREEEAPRSTWAEAWGVRSASPVLAKDSAAQRGGNGRRGLPLKDATNIPRQQGDSGKIAEPALSSTASAGTLPSAAEPPRGFLASPQARAPAMRRRAAEAEKAAIAEPEDEMAESGKKRRSRQRDDRHTLDLESAVPIETRREIEKRPQRARSPPARRPAAARSLDFTPLDTAAPTSGRSLKREKSKAKLAPFPAPNTTPFAINAERVIAEINKNTEAALAVPPRPGPRAEAEEQKAAKRSIFRRALDRIGPPKSSNLDDIEEMLSQLLAEVDDLKMQTQQAAEGGVVAKQGAV